MRKKSNGENVKKSENVRKIECVIDDEDMWRFKFEHLEELRGWQIQLQRYRIQVG